VAPDGSIEAIALAGGLSPRGFHYQSFGQPGLVALPSSSGPLYYGVFTATMQEGNRSFIELNSSVSTHPEITTGDPIEGNTLAGFTVSRPGNLAFGLVMDLLRPDGSQFKRAATWAADSLVLANNAKTGGEIDGGAGIKDRTIKDILGPPGLFFQAVTVAVVLKGGRMVLANMPVLLGLSVVEEQGKRAPGRAGFKLKSFAPPSETTCRRSRPGE
ncbi:MAG TPA: hypothetical protein VI756_03820, partial [Blastocatellia bacterium]